MKFSFAKKGDLTVALAIEGEPSNLSGKSNKECGHLHQCLLCLREFPTISFLETHYANKHRIRNAICAKCERCVQTSHIKYHICGEHGFPLNNMSGTHKPLFYQCDVCAQHFSEKHFKKHIKQNMDTDRNSQSPSCSRFDNQPQPKIDDCTPFVSFYLQEMAPKVNLKCGFCLGWFSNLIFQQHILLCKQKLTVTCKFCKELLFITRRELKMHEQWCKKQFETKQIVQETQREDKSGQHELSCKQKLTVTCQVCLEAFSESERKMHEQSCTKQLKQTKQKEERSSQYQSCGKCLEIGFSTCNADCIGGNRRRASMTDKSANKTTAQMGVAVVPLGKNLKKENFLSTKEKSQITKRKEESKRDLERKKERPKVKVKCQYCVYWFAEATFKEHESKCKQEPTYCRFCLNMVS